MFIVSGPVEVRFDGVLIGTTRARASVCPWSYWTGFGSIENLNSEAEVTYSLKLERVPDSVPLNRHERRKVAALQRKAK